MHAFAEFSTVEQCSRMEFGSCRLPQLCSEETRPNFGFGSSEKDRCACALHFHTKCIAPVLRPSLQAPCMGNPSHHPGTPLASQLGGAPMPSAKSRPKSIPQAQLLVLVNLPSCSQSFLHRGMPRTTLSNFWHHLPPARCRLCAYLPASSCFELSVALFQDGTCQQAPLGRGSS